MTTSTPVHDVARAITTRPVERQHVADVLNDLGKLTAVLMFDIEKEGKLDGDPKDLSEPGDLTVMRVMEAIGESYRDKIGSIQPNSPSPAWDNALAWRDYAIELWLHFPAFVRACVAKEIVP